MNKYYIANKISFIQGLGNFMKTPSSATHFTSSDALQFLNMHPNYVTMIHGNSKKRNVVISTPQKFLGINGAIVSSIKEARAFYSPEDAYMVLNNEFGLADKFGEEMVIIDNNFKSYQPKQEKRPLVVISNNCPNKGSKRRNLGGKIKSEIIATTQICPICGLPLDESATIDHIVPLSRGGTNKRTNLRPVHEACNKLKGNLLDNELKKSVVAVGSNMVYNSPSSDMSMAFIRSIVRGTIAQHKLYS